MKDRPAAAMIAAALGDGTLTPGMTVVESSSGNMAVGLAQACAYHGVKFLCIADARTQAANVDLVRAYGGDVEIIEHPDPATGDFLTARLARIRQIVAARDDVFWPNQYANPENPRSHAAGTVRQLLAECGGLDVLLVATSTTGTLNGAIACCRRHSPRTRVVAVDAAGSVLFGGSRGPRAISGLGAGLQPPLADAAAPHDVLRVDDADCVVGCRTLVRVEGILAGGSSGGLLTALSRVAPSMETGTRVGLILPDHGSRYLQTVYRDEWVEQTCGLSEAEVSEAVTRLTAEVSR